MKAKMGRAAWIAERSVGHQDPGATSFYLMWKSAVEYLTPGAEKGPSAALAAPVALAAAYLQYASLGLRRAALHLDLFEQPGRKRVFSTLLRQNGPPEGCAAL